MFLDLKHEKNSWIEEMIPEQWKADDNCESVSFKGKFLVDSRLPSPERRSEALCISIQEPCVGIVQKEEWIFPRENKFVARSQEYSCHGQASVTV